MIGCQVDIVPIYVYHTQMSNWGGGRWLGRHLRLKLLPELICDQICDQYFPCAALESLESNK